MKMMVDNAQNRYVCSRLEGANGPKVNEPCHTSSVTSNASRMTPEPNTTRLRMNSCLELYVIVELDVPETADKYRVTRRRAALGLNPSQDGSPLRNAPAHL